MSGSVRTTPVTGAGSPPRPVTPVGILAATLDRIALQLDAVPGIDPGLLAELLTARDMAEGLDPYLSACTTPESAALRSLAERTAAHDWDAHGDKLEQEMLSGHVEGQFLTMLVHATRAQRVLDVGMFTGYSALAMAEALPAGGRVVACEIDADVAAFAQECFDASPDGGKVLVKVGPAAETLAQLAVEGETFDLVFIDADKPGYPGYVDAVLEAGLLAPHGIVCVDNTLMQGLPYLTGPTTANGAAIAAFNRRVAADPRVEQVLVPLRDGITMLRRVSGER